MLLPVFCFTNNAAVNTSVHVSCSFCTSGDKTKWSIYLYYLPLLFSQLFKFLTFLNTGFMIFTFAYVIITCPFVLVLVLCFNKLGAHHQSFWKFLWNLFGWSWSFNSSSRKHLENYVPWGIVHLLLFIFE